MVQPNQPSPSIQFTIFTGPQRLTKFLYLEDGELCKDAPDNAGRGTTRTIKVTLEQLPDVIDQLHHNQCLVHGVTELETASITPTGFPRPGAIHRNKAHFRYPVGPALLMLDHDPDAERGGISPSKLFEVLVAVFPAMATAAKVTKLSTSSEIYTEDGRCLSSPTPGHHTYIAVLDGGDIPRFGKVLFRRLWLAGHGYGRLSVAGSFLPRSLIDASVFSPERCDFVAGAVLGEGLVQHLGPALYHPGGALDTRALPDLDTNEEAEFHRLVVLERDRLKPDMEATRTRYTKDEATRTGESVEAVRERLEAVDGGFIHPDTRLRLKEGGSAKLCELIAARRHGVYVEDPTEESETWARFYVDPDGGKIRSFLHGGRVLRVGVTGSTMDLGSVVAADLDGVSYKDALGRLGRANSASVALAIVHRFARTVPVSRTAEKLLADIADRAPDLPQEFLDQLRGRLDWIVGRRDKRLNGMTEISEAVKRRHRYEVRTVDEITMGETEFSSGVIVLKAPCGTGKTQRVGRPLADWARRHGHRFAALCHRVSLTAELARRLKAVNYQEPDAEPQLRAAGALAVCVNSVTGRHASFCGGVEVLLVDEASQVLRHLANGSIREADRPRVFNAFKAMVRDARTVVLADADMNGEVVEFLEACRPGETFLIIEAQADHGHLTVQWDYGRGAVAASYGDILVRLAAGEKLIVATDSVRKCRTLLELIRTELPDLKVLVIDSDHKGEAEQQAFIRDPNGECVQYACVVHSPTISSGVSIEVDHFTRGFGLFFGAIAPSDALQMMRRARSLKEWTLALDQNNSNEADDLGALQGGLQDALEQTGGGALTDFDELRTRVRAWEATGRNNFAAGLLRLLETHGFRVQHQPLTLLPEEVEDIQLAREMAEQEHLDAIVGARRLFPWEAEQLRGKPNLSLTDQMALTRWKILEGLKLTEVSEADVKFWDGGRGLRRLQRFELALGRHTPEGVGVPTSQRRFGELKAHLYQRLLEPLGVDLGTGEGAITRHQARQVVDAAMEQPRLLVTLGVVPASILRARPKNEVKFVQAMLDLLGVKTVSSRAQVAGDRSRSYRLDPAAWSVMRGRADHRNQAESGHFPPSVITVKGPCGHFSHQGATGQVQALVFDVDDILDGRADLQTKAGGAPIMVPAEWFAEAAA